MTDSESLTSAPLRAPRAGAIAGILFSLLLGTSLVLTRIAVPADPSASAVWIQYGAGTFAFAMNLLPFAGLAFLWFIGVIRDRLGALEDRFFATVFFGSGLLFIASLFCAAAIAGGMMMVYASGTGRLVESGTYAFGRAAIYLMINVYAMKMAGAFMISTATIALRTGIFPRWMALLGYALAIVAILSSAKLYWAPLAFPLWVLLVSTHVLVTNFRSVPEAGR
jgi:hypothetical protein